MDVAKCVRSLPGEERWAWAHVYTHSGFLTPVDLHSWKVELCYSSGSEEERKKDIQLLRDSVKP